MHAPLVISLIIGLVIGFLAQKVIFMPLRVQSETLFYSNRPIYLRGFVSLTITAFITNLVINQFNPGFIGQPVAIPCIFGTLLVWCLLD